MTEIIYKTTYTKIYNSLPKWKQIAIDEDSLNNNWSGILKDFVLKVIEESEKEQPTVSNPVKTNSKTTKKTNKVVKR